MVSAKRQMLEITRQLKGSLMAPLVTHPTLSQLLLWRISKACTNAKKANGIAIDPRIIKRFQKSGLPKPAFALVIKDPKLQMIMASR